MAEMILRLVLLALCGWRRLRHAAGRTRGEGVFTNAVTGAAPLAAARRGGLSCRDNGRGKAVHHRVAAGLLALAFGVLPSLPAAHAETGDTAKWGQVGSWQIRVDRTVGNGCFAMQVFERGTVVRIGVDVESNRIYLVFGHDNWKSLEEGKTYPVRVVFDGVSSYDGEMKGQRLGSVIFLTHRDLSTGFVRDFMQRNGMQVFYRGQQIANLSLANTYAAVAEVMNCQKELFASGAAGAPRDPFARTPSSGGRKDPFQ